MVNLAVCFPSSTFWQRAAGFPQELVSILLHPLLPSILTSATVPTKEKILPQQDATITMHYCSMGSYIAFLADILFGITFGLKIFNLLFGKLKWDLMCFFLSCLFSCNPPIQARFVEHLRYCRHRQTMTNLTKSSNAFKVAIGLLVASLSSFFLTLASNLEEHPEPGRVLVVANTFHFLITDFNCAPRDVKSLWNLFANLQVILKIVCF